MYGISNYIWVTFSVDVGKYSIHESSIWINMYISIHIYIYVSLVGGLEHLIFLVENDNLS